MSGRSDPSTTSRGQLAVLENPRTIANEPLESAVAEPSHTSASDAADLVAHSAVMREVCELARSLATSDIPVLIQGETGVGKGVIAEYIRNFRSTQDGPFVWVNCGSIPEQLAESTLFGHERGAFTGATERSKGVFEAAHGGTLVLDEIGELCPSAQAALLRVLDSHRFSRLGSARELHVDVRILAATHRNLDQMCEQKEFRRDLLYRINAGAIIIPPLRERPEDIEPLARHFLRRSHSAGGVQATELDARAVRVMKEHAWPGNVRELQHAVMRGAAVAGGDQITASDLPPSVHGGGCGAAGENRWPRPHLDRSSAAERTRWDLRAQVREFEASLIRAALQRACGNKTECARLLRIPYRTCVRKIELLLNSDALG